MAGGLQRLQRSSSNGGVGQIAIVQHDQPLPHSMLRRNADRDDHILTVGTRSDCPRSCFRERVTGGAVWVGHTQRLDVLS
eukprot:2040296-Prymnesium_polylepis.1